MKKRLCIVLSTILAGSLNAFAESHPAVEALMKRIDTSGTLATKVEARLDDKLGSAEQFILSAPEEPGTSVLIRGNTLSALTTGVNWYLNHYVHLNLTWNQPITDMSRLEMPTVSTADRHTTDAPYRYYLNYCTFGYSMATWSWSRWQQEIDWMALHGVNMPLQIVGLEAVWRSFLMEDCGYSEAEAEAFVPGPAYTGWWGMNNLEGWGGDGADQAKGMTDNAWYERQATLGRRIVARQRELGMEPVLPGYSGMVPTNFTKKTGMATETTNRWCGFARPYIQDPTDKAFALYAAKYYAQLERVLGRSAYYSMDPFHEGGTISSGAYAEGYRAVFDAMNTYAGTQSKWVLQQWQWAGYQSLSLTAIPSRRLIVLDLFADGKPAFRDYNGYTPQEAIYCTIPNFGGRSGMMGRLKAVSANYFASKAAYSTIKGVGAAPEAIEQTPVTYDLLFELPWMKAEPDVSQWLDGYVTSRYGKECKAAGAVWQDFLQTILAFGTDGIQGPIEDVWAARPNLQSLPASSWGCTVGSTAASQVYTVERQQKFAEAVASFIALADELSSSENYHFDLIESTSQVMADYAYYLLRGIGEARAAKDEALARKRMDTFLQLILDMDTFKGTNSNFRTGHRTEQARLAASEVEGATTATPDWYELNNARQLITTWGDRTNSDNAGLHDYSYRSWQGIIRDLYYARWKYYFDHDCTEPAGGWFLMEWDWAHRLKWSSSHTGKSTVPLREGEPGYAYTTEPEGNTCDEASRLFNTYLLPVTVGNGTKYAYRSLATDLQSSLIIPLDRANEETLTLPLDAALLAGMEPVISIDFNGDGVFQGEQEILPYLPGMVIAPTSGGSINAKAELCLKDGTTIRFTVRLTKHIEQARRVSVRSSNRKVGTVSIGGVSSTSVENKEAVTCCATPRNGYTMRGWYTEDGTPVSTETSYTYTDAEPISLVAYFDVKAPTYPAVTADFKDKATIQDYKQYVNTISVSIGGAAATRIYSTEEMPDNLQQHCDKVTAKAGSTLRFTWTGNDGLKYLYVTAWMDTDGDGVFDATPSGTLGTVQAQDDRVINGSISVRMPSLKAGKFTILRLRFDSAWNIAGSATTEATRFYYDIPLTIGTSVKLYKGMSTSSTTIYTQDVPVMSENYLGIVSGADIPESLSGATNIVCNGMTDELRLTDGKNFYAPSDFTAGEVTYNRTNASPWDMIILPFSAGISEQARFYTLKDASISEGSLTFVPEQEPEANTPYLLHCDTEAFCLNLTDATVKATTSTSTCNLDNADGQWVLRGIYRNSKTTASSTQQLFTVDQNRYALQGGAFELEPFHGYLSFTPSGAKLEHDLTILTGSDEDGLKGIRQNANGSVSLRYDLSGRRVNRPDNAIQPIITIQDGRKSLRQGRNTSN